MKRLFFVYIPVFIFSLTLIVNGLRGYATEKETVLPTQTEQLSEAEDPIYISNHYSFYYQLGADEGITVPHGRRFGLNKPPKTNLYSHNNMYGGKNIPAKVSLAKNERHFIQYLTTRHSQGFYIYSLNELLL